MMVTAKVKSLAFLYIKKKTIVFPCILQIIKLHFHSQWLHFQSDRNICTFSFAENYTLLYMYNRMSEPPLAILSYQNY